MAEDINVVDPDGGGPPPYTSLNAYESNEQADLTAGGGTQATANCKCTGGSADTASVNFVGWTTDATNYIKIWTDSADIYRHDGKWTTGNVYRMEVTTTGDGESVIDIDENYVRVDGIQIAVTNDDFDTVAAIRPDSVDAGNDVRVSNCILKGVGLSGAGDNVRGVYCTDADMNLTMWNTIVYDFVNGTVGCAGVRFNNGNLTLYNSTFIGSRQNIEESTAGTMNAYNTVAFGATQAGSNWLGTWDAGTNNATEGTDADMPQTDRVDNVVSGDFEDYANDDFHLASGSALIDQGVDDPGSGLFSDDIDGDIRSTWDIGADEFVPAVTVPDDTYAPTMQLMNSGGMIGAVNV